MPADPLTLSLVGVSLVGEVFGALDTASTARKQKRLLRKQIEEFKKQKIDLEKAYRSRKGIITDQYGRRLDEAGRVFSVAEDEIVQAEQDAYSKTGFLESGAIEKRSKGALEKTGFQFSSDINRSKDFLNESLLELDTNKQKQLTTINTAIKEAERNVDLFSNQDSFFEALF